MADRGWEVVEDWGVEPEDHVVESAKNAPVDPKRFSLNKDPYYSGYDAVRDEDKKTRWSDVGQALQVGAVNTAEAPAIIADYMTSGAIGSDARREAELTKRDLMAGMTPQGRRAATAPFLAEEGQEGAADVGMKDWLMMGAAQNAAPMVMSIFPAWMATGAAARMGMGVAAQGAIGAGVARASSAAQSAADTASSILDEVDSVPDEKLITIPRVQQFVDEGMNLSEARGRYRTEVAKYYPFLAAIVGAVGAAPEAEAVKTLAGASAKKGLKGAIGQIAGGAAEEFGEEGSGAALSEIAGSQAALSDIDYHNIISNALGGAAQGGVLHGPSALVHLGADGVAPDQKVALETQATKPATQTQSVDVNATSLTTPSARLLEPEVEPATEPDEVVDRTMSARVPADKMAAMQGAFEGREIPPKENVAAPAQSMWPDENAWNTPEDEWEPVDTWGQPEAEPDVVRYDDGTTEEVSAPTLRTVEQPPPFRPGRPTGWMTPATEEAIRQAEAARAPASEQEAYDAYDDYKAEQNAEPDVAYGVDEEPEEEPELAPAEPASSSVQTPEAPAKYVNTRGGKERFHGTGAPIQKLSDQVALQAGHDKNFYGDGFYTTDAVDMAMGYTKKGGKEPTLYKVKEKPVKLYDMEAPIDAKTRAMVENVLGEYYPTKSYNEETGEDTHHNTLREILDEFRDQSAGNNLPRYEVQEYFNSIRTELEKQGYRGYRQAGGVKTNNETHDVKIFWRPEQDVSITKADAESYKQSEPSSSVQTEPASEVSEGAVKPKRIRRTKEQIAADNAAKETARAEKAAAREAAKTEKARLALEAAQKRAAEKAARSKAPAKTKTAPAIAASTTVEPATENNTPSGVIQPVYVSVAERLANKTRVSAEGSHESNTQKAQRVTKKKVAEEEFFNAEHQPTEDEVHAGAEQADLLRGDTTPKGTLFIRSDKQRAALKARLQKFVKAVEDRSGPINPNVTKNSSNYEMYARVAKDVLKYIDNGTARSQQALDDFIADEMAARKGDFGPMRKRRLEEGDQNSRPNNELNEETTASSSGFMNQQFAPAPDEVEDHIREQRVSDMKNAARDIIARHRTNNRSVDLTALYLELANDFPDVIGDFPFRSQGEIEASLREASAKQSAPKPKSGGAMTPKVTQEVTEPAAQEPPPKRQISKEESDRYVQMLNETAKRDAERSTIQAKPREDTPIWETGQKISAAAAKNETMTAKDRLSKATAELSQLRSAVSDLVAQKKFEEAKRADQRMRDLESEIKKLRQSTENSAPNLFFKRRNTTAAEDISSDLKNEFENDRAAMGGTVLRQNGTTYLRSIAHPDSTHVAQVLVSSNISEIVSTGLNAGRGLTGRLTDFVANMVKRLAGDVQVHFLSQSDYDATRDPHSQAYYAIDAYEDYIVIPIDLLKNDPEMFQQVFLHEAVHAALARRLQVNPVAAAQLNALADYLKQQFDYTNSVGPNDYSWASPHEFLSEVLSRADLQEALKGIQLTPDLANLLEVKQWRKTSIWNAFLEKVSEWLGYKGPMNALEGVLSVTNRVINNDIRNIPSELTAYTDQNGWAHPQNPFGHRPIPGQQLNLFNSKSSLNPEDVTAKVKDATQTAKDYGQSILNKTQRFLTKAATLDQIRQMHEGLFVDQNGKDVLGKLVAAVQRVTPMANKLRAQSDELAQRYLDLRKSNPEMADEFATLALDATSANVRLGPDPTRLNNKHLKNGGRNAQGKELLDKLQDRYKALSPEAKQLYQDMAAYYRDMQNKMVRSIVDNRLKDYGIEPPNRAEFIEKLVTGKQLSEADKALFKDKAHALKRMKEVSQLRVVQGDYFPMMRYGKFVVNTNNKIEDHMGGVEIEPGKVEFRAKTDKEARALAERFAGDVGLPQTNWQKSPLTQANDFGYIVSVQTRGAHFFESEAEAIAWRREHADEFDEISEVSPIRETGLQGGDLTTAQLNSLQATVRNSNYSEEEKAAMLDMLKQGSAVLMSGNRIQKRSIARRKVLGASTNFGRNVLQYGEAASSRVAQLEHRPEIDAALDEMREINKNLMDKRQPERTALLNEVSERVNANVTNIKQPPRWLSDIMSVTFLSRLASPMYSVVNAMQPWMVTYPVLAGRYGPARAASMMTQAYGSIGFTEQAFAGIKNTYLAGKNFNSAAILDTTDVAKSIREKLKSQYDGAELSKVIDMLIERGGMSEGGFEMAQAISQGRGVFGTTLAKVDRIARQAPAAVEDINRAVSAIAAYRLARTSMSEEKAREHAFDVVMNTQGDYSGVNAPRFFNETWLRPAFQFKKYAQMMTYVLADMTHRAFGPNSSKEERKVALGQLGSLMAVQIAMAGTLSLPGIELAKMGFMVAAALGFGGGWDDQEEKLRKIADESFGAEWGQLISRGVLTRALNMDFSQKFSLADMYTFGEPRKYDKEGLGSYFTQMVAGAPGGTLMDMLGAVQGMTQGDWSTNDAAIGTMAKAAEKFIPVKIIGDAFKAANRYSEGKANEYEAVLNLLGVQSANQAEENRKTGNSIRQREAYQANYKRLGDAYLKARNAGDRARLRVEIAKHNKSVPLRYRVFPNSLDQVRNRIEAERAN